MNALFLLAFVSGIVALLGWQALYRELTRGRF